MDSLAKHRGKRVLVSCCSNRNPKWAMILSVEGAMDQASKAGIACAFPPRIGESLICRARNNELVVMRQRNFDYLFSIDDDVDIPPETIVKLISDDKDVVAGFYRLKSSEPHTAVRLPADGPNLAEVLKRGLLTPAIYVSTGCFLVKREVVEGMVAKYPELEYTRNVTNDKCWALYQPYIYRGEYLSEDWAFCQRARDAGFEIWADGSIRCGHWREQRVGFGDI